MAAFGSGKVAFPMIATRDIGELAAALLVEGTPGATQIVELAGASSSFEDAAKILSGLVGKPIAVTEVPLEAIAQTLKGMGMPDELAGLYQEMITGMAQGHVRFEGGHRTVEGKTRLDAVLSGLLKR